MMTMRLFAEQPQTIPAATSWYLADLGEALGRQEIFTKQSPQKLKVLREHAMIESAMSSNRMEGVIVDQARVGTVVFGKATLRDRNEEEGRACDTRDSADIWGLPRFRPATGVDWIRQVLKDLRGQGVVECVGRGRNASWRKTKGWKLGSTGST